MLKEESVKNKGKISNRCMTAVLGELVFCVLTVAVMVSVCSGLRSSWDSRKEDVSAQSSTVSEQETEQGY